MGPYNYANDLESVDNFSEVSLNFSYVSDADFTVLVGICQSLLLVGESDKLGKISLNHGRVVDRDSTAAVNIAEDGLFAAFGDGDGELSAGLGAEVELGKVELNLNGLRLELGVEGDVVTVVNSILSLTFEVIIIGAAEVVRPCAVDSKLDLTVEAFANVCEAGC